VSTLALEADVAQAGGEATSHFFG